VPYGLRSCKHGFWAPCYTRVLQSLLCPLVLLLALLLFPPSTAVYYFAEKFMLWSAFQALVMLVQNRYQKRRMYTRIAMGKNSAMDVVSGESSGSAGQLMVLYPLLFSECQAV